MFTHPDSRLDTPPYTHHVDPRLLAAVASYERTLRLVKEAVASRKENGAWSTQRRMSA